MSDISDKQSLLVLIGGAEDKTREKIVLQKLVKKTNAKSVAIIPTASDYPRDVADNYHYAFRDLGIQNIETIDIRYTDECDRNKNIEIISKTDLVFFSGGDQVKLVDVLKGSRFIEIIRDRFKSGNLPIAGTSAGAASASSPMIFDGDYRGFEKGTVNFADGFNWLDDVTVDTHFTQRERITRLSQFLLAGHSQKAIGIDEDTAIFIYPNLRFEVVGSGMVTVLNSEKTTFNNFEKIDYKEKFTTNNLRLGYLAPGAKFSIRRWSVLKPSQNQTEKGIASLLMN